MANTITRRPLPALVSLIALLALTGIVWWRVINRDDSDNSASKPTSTPSCTTSQQPPPTTTVVSPKSVTVRVLNSTERNGIAGRARTKLMSYGFRSPSIASDDSATVSIKQSAQIRYGTAGAAGARLLQFYLPGSVLSKVDTKSATVTVSLGDAYKGVASAASAKAAIAKATRPSGTPSGTPSSSGSASSSATSPTC